MDVKQPSEATTIHLPERPDDDFVREDLAGADGHGLASLDGRSNGASTGSVQSMDSADGMDDESTFKRLTAPRRRWPVAVAPARWPAVQVAPRRIGKAWARAPLGGRIAAGLLLTALVAALVFAVVRSLPPDLATSRATIGTLNVSFSTTGLLQSAAYDVNFGTQGKVAEIDVKVGQTVTQGQTLAKLDTKLLQDGVNSAQAQVQAAQSSLSGAQATQAQVQAQGQAAISTAAQQQAACKTSDAVCVNNAQQSYAQAQAQASAQNAAAQAAVNAAQSQLTVAQGNLQAAQDGLASATLTAPHDGTVAQIFGTVGSAVGPGNGAAFIHLVDLGSLQLVAQVSANDVGAVQAQQAARFTVPTFTGRMFLGAVDTISPVGAPGGGVTRYPVTIDVDMNSVDGARLLPGMTATVTITTYSRIGVLVVPARAVAFANAAGDPKHGGFLPKSQAQKAQRDAQQLLLQYESAGRASGTAAPTPAYLLERTKDGQWVAVPVLLGQTDGNVYEVLSAGMAGSLKQGDTVVTDWHGGPVTPPSPTPATH